MVGANMMLISILVFILGAWFILEYQDRKEARRNKEQAAK